MALPALNYFVGVKVTLALRTDSTTTKSVYFCNRPNLSAAGYSTVYWPLLVGLSEVGVEAGRYLPEVTGGSFEIDNTIGTFGYQRKFSDLLERYEIVNQDVTIYLDAIAFDAEAPTFDSGAQIWTGKIESYEQTIAEGRSTLIVSMKSDLIPDRRLGMFIDETLTTFADAPDSSLGKFLPVCAGPSVYVPCYRISATPGSACYYAFAADLVDAFEHDRFSGGSGWSSWIDSSGWLHQYLDGVWVEIKDTGSWNQYVASSSSSIALDTYAEVIFEFTNSAGSCVASSAGVYFTPNGGGAHSSTMMIQASIYEIDSTSNGVGRLVARGSYDMGDSDTENNAGSAFVVDIPFDRPAVLDFDRFQYAFGLSGSTYTSGDASWQGSTTTANRWTRVKSSAGAYGHSWSDDGSQNRCNFTIYNVYLSGDAQSSYNNDAGFTAHSALFSEGNSQTIDFSTLDPIVRMNGLEDDGSGTITGTPDLVLYRPDYFLAALDYEWNGSAWAAASKWDLSTLSTEYDFAFDASTSGADYSTDHSKARFLSGFYAGEGSYYDVIETLCKDMACRVGVNNSGKLFLWPWGPHYDAAATFDPADIQPVAWSAGDPTTVINDARIGYNRTFANLDVARNVATDQPDNFKATVHWSPTDKDECAAIVGESEDLYGKREHEDIETSFIYDSGSADALAESIVARFAKPTTLCSFYAPYHKYSAVKQFDVVSFSHPEFPAFYGTDAEAKEPVEEGADAGDANLKDGRDWYRAQTYRGQVEARYIELPFMGAPRLRFVVRVLNNYPGDPT